jgi:subtilisin family serine protease
MLAAALLLSVGLCFSQTPDQPAPPQSSAKVYKIGDTGPAGGVVFYDKGAVSYGWRYLEAASRDVGNVQWGLLGKDVIGTLRAIGTGKRNTQLILDALNKAGETGKAAQVCVSFTQGGYSDWFLPSEDELDRLYGNLKQKGLGGFRDDWGDGDDLYYWSSTQYDYTYAWYHSFGVGNQVLYKSLTIYVRPIRAF